MAWARLVTYPGGTQEQYQAVIDEIGEEGMKDAPGRQYLVAGPSERGWQMFMVWDSQQSFGQWAMKHVGPAHERVGDRGWKAEPEVLDFETFLIID